jgi:phospholipid-translocating ATPase
MEELILTSATHEEFSNKLTKEIKKRGITLSDDFRDLSAIKKKPDQKTLCMIIDGPTLAFALSEEKQANAFFKLGLHAASVVCCRVSPAQKAQVTALAKTNGPWITLSIGDGANDVPMIMEAHIGVGIRGKEGT